MIIMKKVNRAYVMSHLKLRDEIYFNFGGFSNNFFQGKEKIREYFCKLWNSIDINSYNNNYILIDSDEQQKNIELSDFDVGVKQINGVNVLFFEMPESYSYCQQAKIIAIVFLKSGLRYFTLEIESESKCLVGEWLLVDDDFVHINYNKIYDDYITNFLNSLNIMLKNVYNI